MSEEIKREQSTMELWAENEVKIACHRENPNRKEGEFDYGCACYESALKAFQSLCEDEHSGAKSKGRNVVEQFEEWDHALDDIYFDEETGRLMQSVTVQGGDVEQIPYEENTNGD